MNLAHHLNDVRTSPCYRAHPLATLQYSYAKWTFALHRVAGPEAFLANLGISPYDALRNFPKWRRVLERVAADVRAKQGHQGAVSFDDGVILFGLVSALQPECVVETGVAAGASNAFLNAALIENGHGRLYSIELPPAQRGPTADQDGGVFAWPESGLRWAVPPEIRDRIGERNIVILEDVRTALPKLVKALPCADIFFHDDLHTPDHMLWEYQLVWPWLSQNGILVSDDANFAWLRFCRNQQIGTGALRNVQRLTAAIKNGIGNHGRPPL